MKRATLSSAKKKAWKQFSLYIRLSAANEFGLIQCYTCPARSHYKEMQAGHWVEGHSNVVYINEDYVRPQCASCNIFHKGRQGEFRDLIRKELGDARVEELLIESKQIKKISIQDYMDLENKYKDLIKELV